MLSPRPFRGPSGSEPGLRPAGGSILSLVVWKSQAYFICRSSSNVYPVFPQKKHQSDDSSGLLMAIIDRIYVTARLLCLVFGLLSDRYGRRWLLTLNMMCLGGTVLGTTFVHNYTHFLILRALFAFILGGTYALALESLPAHARGFVSGFFQHGYFMGYFIAAGVEMTLVTPLNDWRASCYVGSGLSFFTAGLCAICPDSEIYIQLRQEPQLYPNPDKPSRTKTFLKSLRFAILNHWKRSIYCIILLTAFHSLSHISMDSYQKFLIDE
ncbi:hypothetical protein H4Q26_018013 [Puccinia striiformis f. sp. tritici PST-130]|nr:hypothetical protein H4Q26_018013 [Puccinia striiformis f. sp. tritici PST-130]